LDKNIKIILSIGIIAIIAVIVVVFFLNSKSTVYRIGTILPLTGAGSNLGIPTANGMQLAVDEINKAGGINGYKVELFIQDGKLKGKDSVDAVNFLLNIKHPDIVTTLFHLPAQSISPILKKAKVPLIYEAFTRSIWKDNSYSFKAHFDSLTGCEKLIKYAKEHKRYQKLGVLMARVEYNELCLEGIKKVEPNVKEYWYTFGEKDFRTLFTKAHSDGVDALMTIGIDFEYINMFKELTELGYPIKMITATATESIFPKVIKSSSPKVLNSTLSIDFIPMSIDKSEFAKKYREKYKSKYSTIIFSNYAYGAIGYEEIQYITKAMEKCKPGDRICLIEALKKVKDYRSAINSKGFNDRVLQLTTQIYDFRNDKWVKLR